MGNSPLGIKHPDAGGHLGGGRDAGRDAGWDVGWDAGRDAGRDAGASLQLVQHTLRGLFPRTPTLLPVPGQDDNATSPKNTPPRLCPVAKLTAPGCRGVLQRVAHGEQHTCERAERRGSARPCHPPTQNHSKNHIFTFFLKRQNMVGFAGGLKPECKTRRVRAGLPGAKWDSGSHASKNIPCRQKYPCNPKHGGAAGPGRLRITPKPLCEGRRGLGSPPPQLKGFSMAARPRGVKADEAKQPHRWA